MRQNFPSLIFLSLHNFVLLRLLRLLRCGKLLSQLALALVLFFEVSLFWLPLPLTPVITLYTQIQPGWKIIDNSSKTLFSSFVFVVLSSAYNKVIALKCCVWFDTGAKTSSQC